MEKVRADKSREAGDGHDGTWVAHPGLVGIAKEIFDREMPQPNQIARKRQDVHVAAADLLAVPTGTITEAGLRQNLNVGIGYIEAWLRGTGCVPLYNLMEDAATAEISRAQVWQWIRHGAQLEDGRNDRRRAVQRRPRRGARQAARSGRRRSLSQRALRRRGAALPRIDRGRGLPRIFDRARLRFDHRRRCLTRKRERNRHPCSSSTGSGKRRPLAGAARFRPDSYPPPIPEWRQR